MTLVEYSVPVLCLLLSWALTKWRISHAHNRDLLAVPNARSSHTQPTPTSGGWAFVVTMFVYCIYAVSVGNDDVAWLGLMLVIATPIAVVGYIDDRGHLPALVRLVSHFVGAAVLVFLLPRLPELPGLGLHLMPHMVIGIGYVVALAWLLNLFNFMDGIDGLAGMEAITTLLGAALILWLNNHTQWLQPLLALAMCTAGFLVLNWPPAKIFMGDVGSGFLGFMLGAFALLTSVTGGISLWSWIILLAVFVADATVTLVRRGLRRQRLYEAHRSHAYQILARRWGSHQRVTMAVLVVNLLWLLPLAWLASNVTNYGVIIVVCAYLPLLVVAVRVGAGTTND